MQVRLRFTGQPLTAVPYPTGMTYMNARVGACPTASLCSAGVRLHLGTQGQMPPAFLVLHASMRRCLDCPRRHVQRYPAVLLAACPGSVLDHYFCECDVCALFHDILNAPPIE